MRRLRRRLRLTMISLVDVIFLLLLIFMLTSTFTRHAEIDLAAAAVGRLARSERRLLFLQLAVDRIALNRKEMALKDLGGRLSELADRIEAATPLLVSLSGDVSAQRPTDLLAALRGVEGIRTVFLGAT
jgi:biopolymer transport protein ExbD